MKWYHLDIRQITDGEFDAWYAMADEGRRKKCDAMRRREDRLCCIGGDHLARTGLAACCGVAPEAIIFARTADGKPFAVGLKAHFNISHSGDVVACAVSEKPVGIDVEKIRPVKARLAEKICTPAELDWLRAAPGWADTLAGEAVERFFRIWTAKEAWFKWTGTGITDLKAVDTLAHIRSGGTFGMDGYMVSIYEA